MKTFGKQQTINEFNWSPNQRNIPASEQTIDGYMELHDLGIYGEIEDTPQGSIKMKKNGKVRNTIDSFPFTCTLATV